LSLSVVVSANVPEILREAGPEACILHIKQSQSLSTHQQDSLQGLHIKDIGDKCGADPDKMGKNTYVRISLQNPQRPTGRILRYLATNHFFTEVLPDTFAGNRISSVLDTGKSVAALKAE
jgi:hypothetical protein